MKRIKITRVNKLHFCIFEEKKQTNKRTQTGDRIKNGAERWKITNKPTNKVHRFLWTWREKSSRKKGFEWVLCDIWDNAAWTNVVTGKSNMPFGTSVWYGHRQVCFPFVWFTLFFQFSLFSLCLRCGITYMVYLWNWQWISLFHLNVG